MRVYTLGRFAVEVGDEPARFGVKGPRKPLALLKALIARGGHTVPSEALIEALWPDAEGDRAERALRVALHRLRGLLGREAVLRSAGNLSLNPALCWVDGQAFLAHLDAARAATAAGDAEAAWSESERALHLYRGPFLAGESDPPEVLGARERLHGAFLRHVAALGDFLAAVGEGERAILLYEQGLERDPLAEPFYRGLMRCHGERGRTAEALAVCERLRTVLSERMDAPLSAETEALRRSLISERPAPGEGPGVAKHRTDATSLDDLRRSARFPLPAKPSIAVLAFATPEGDAAQRRLAEAISENIITDLSHLQNVFVIAPGTSFAYRGQPADVRTVGRELGVRYVLDGRVQQAGGRVRVTAHLSDAAGGQQVWGDRFDCTGDDLLVVQDQIGWQVATELEVKLTEGEQARNRRARTRSLEAYDLYSQGLAQFRRFQREGNRLARALFESALEIDPDFTEALGALGWSHCADARYGWGGSREGSLRHAEEIARTVQARDGSLAQSYSLLSFVHLLRRAYEAALEQRRRSLELAPSYADGNTLMGQLLLWAGEAERSVPYFKAAMRLSPYYPAWYLGALGDAFRLTGHPEEALEAFRTVVAREPGDTTIGRVRLTALLAELGRTDEARAEAARVLELDPAFSVAQYGASRLYRDAAIAERLMTHLRTAGLPG